LRILRVIGCNLLEICVTHEDAALGLFPFFEKTTTPHFPSRTNPHKPITTTNHKLREHTKSRPRKIPAPSHRDVAARIAVVKRMTHEGRKFIFAPRLREGNRCSGRRPVTWTQRPRGHSERHAHGHL